MTITAYDSFDEMMKDLEAKMKLADSRVKPCQKTIQPGQYFWQWFEEGGFPIFGQVLESYKG